MAFQGIHHSFNRKHLSFVFQLSLSFSTLWVPWKQRLSYSFFFIQMTIKESKNLIYVGWNWMGTVYRLALLLKEFHIRCFKATSNLLPPKQEFQVSKLALFTPMPGRVHDYEAARLATWSSKKVPSGLKKTKSKNPNKLRMVLGHQESRKSSWTVSCLASWQEPRALEKSKVGFPVWFREFIPLVFIEWLITTVNET